MDILNENVCSIVVNSSPPLITESWVWTCIKKIVTHHYMKKYLFVFRILTFSLATCVSLYLYSVPHSDKQFHPPRCDKHSRNIHCKLKHPLDKEKSKLVNGLTWKNCVELKHTYAAIPNNSCYERCFNSYIYALLLIIQRAKKLYCYFLG